MKTFKTVILSGITLSCLALAYPISAASDDKPYKVLKTTQTMGNGGIDYVVADSAGRRLYVPRGNEILVFDLDSLKSVGSITNARARGAAIDPKSHHGFSSSSPVVMWDSKTLKTIKTIDVEGRPDGILFEPVTETIYVFSHSQPNATVINGKDGSILGTIDLGGAPEQAVSDGQGRVYVDIEDKDKIAVVDVSTRKVNTYYELGGKGAAPAGLALDPKNHVLFALCREPAVAVILNAEDGKIITTLPIGKGSDGGGFNPETMEAFSSQGDGTLTIIKETSPTTFEVAQTVQTKPRAKTCTLDTKNGHIILIATEPSAASAPQASSGNTPPPTQPGEGKKRGSGRNNGPSMLDIIVVGK